MKKMLVFLSIFCLLAFSLACGGGSQDSESATDTMESSAAEATDEVSEDAQSLVDTTEETAGEAVEATEDLVDEAK